MKDQAQEQPRYREYWAEILIVTVGFAAVNLIFLSRAFRQSTSVDPETAGQLGSFVGGYVGAFFALTGVVLLFRTLRNQVRVSELQGFENKYFELIKMHRANVAEMELQGDVGRKVFVLLLRELRCALEIVRDVAARHKYELTAPQKMHITYYCLFFGVGPNSSRMLRISLSSFDSAFVQAVEAELDSYETKE